MQIKIELDKASNISETTVDGVRGRGCMAALKGFWSRLGVGKESIKKTPAYHQTETSAENVNQN